MTQKEIEISKLISIRIKRKDPTAKVILFGSHATGKAHNDSDWDILILINKQKKSREVEELYRNELFELELEIEEPISTFIFNQNDWKTKHSTTPLYKNIKAEGISI